MWDGNLIFEDDYSDEEFAYGDSDADAELDGIVDKLTDIEM